MESSLETQPVSDAEAGCRKGEVCTFCLSQLLGLAHSTLAVLFRQPGRSNTYVDMVVVNRDQIRFSPFWEHIEQI